MDVKQFQKNKNYLIKILKFILRKCLKSGFKKK